MGSKQEYESRRAAHKAAQQAKQERLLRTDAEIFVNYFEAFIRSLISGDGYNESREGLINLLVMGKSQK